ncbi:MAG: hypothetical protein AAGF10_01045 [Verrucomicrobiota bacterium]
MNSQELEIAKFKHEQAWSFFKYHAEQRIKAFNFYLIFISITVGIVFRVDFGEVMINPAGAALILFSIGFLIIDYRSKKLLGFSIEALKELEKQAFRTEADKVFRIMCNEGEWQDSKPHKGKIIRFTFVFWSIYMAAIALGILIIFYPEILPPITTGGN